MPYIDSPEYYEHRKTATEMALLRRAYYDGHPYADDKASGYKNDLWVSLLGPTDEYENFPSYPDNVVKTLINLHANSIPPTQTRLVAGELEDSARDELYDKLFYFGNQYGTGLIGFMDWLNQVLIETAKVGDGLLVMRALDDPTHPLRWHYYPAECWGVEMTADADDVLFYRIEYKYKAMREIEGVDRPWEYWRRIDIYRDHIVRYIDTPVPLYLDDGRTPPARTAVDTLTGSLMRPGTEAARRDNLISGGWMPPEMPILEVDLLAEGLERSAMANFGDWIAIPLLWEYGDVEADRGQSELSVSRLQATDDVNRLFTRWKNAVIGAGEPPLAAIDLELPQEGGDEPRELTTSDVGPGAILTASSTGDRAGRMMYPENQPTQFPHKEALERLREAVFEGAPHMGLAPDQLQSYRDITGFMAIQLNYQFDQRINRLRARLIENGIFRAMHNGIRLLVQQGKLPDSMKDVVFHFEYGGPRYSPDEMLKLVTMIGMLQDRNIPAPEISALLQMVFDPVDKKALEAALEEYANNKDLMSQIQQTVLKAKANPASKPADTAGVDKKAR
jgi:hypothetical protein